MFFLLGDSQPMDDTSSTTEVTILLTRLVSIAGSIAFSQMIHVDNSVLGELKRRRAVQEEKKKKPSKKQDKVSCQFIKYFILSVHEQN